MLTVGDRIPQFDLQAVVSLEQDKTFARITDQSDPGKWKVLFFWPKDFTFVCPTEIAAFGKLNREFNDRDAVVYGASTDSEFVHLAWRRQHPDLKNLPFPMLADIKRAAIGGAGDPRQAGRGRAARHFHRRPRGRHPVRVGPRPERRPQRRRSAADAGCAAVRRALPLQLAEGRGVPEGCLSVLMPHGGCSGIPPFSTASRSLKGCHHEHPDTT